MIACVRLAIVWFFASSPLAAQTLSAERGICRRSRRYKFHDLYWDPPEELRALNKLYGDLSEAQKKLIFELELKLGAPAGRPAIAEKRGPPGRKVRSGPVRGCPMGLPRLLPVGQYTPRTPAKPLTRRRRLCGLWWCWWWRAATRSLPTVRWAGYVASAFNSSEVRYADQSKSTFDRRSFCDTNFRANLRCSRF